MGEIVKSKIFSFMVLNEKNIEKGLQIKETNRPEYGTFRVIGIQPGTNFWIIENRAGQKLLDPAYFEQYEIV